MQDQPTTSSATQPVYYSMCTEDSQPRFRRPERDAVNLLATASVEILVHGAFPPSPSHASSVWYLWTAGDLGLHWQSHELKLDYFGPP
jgi:hypothetical protein